MSSNEVREIELSKKEALETLELFKSLERLEKNKDFKRLIKDEYLNKEAVRLVHLKADHTSRSPERQSAVVREIDAIGSFASFLTTVAWRASMAQSALTECEETLDAMREQGADE